MGDCHRANVCSNGENDEPSTVFPIPDSALASTTERLEHSDSEQLELKLVIKNEETRQNVNNLKIGSWNIKRGLITKEIELSEMLNNEDFDIMFLNETDTKQIKSKSDYQLKGYETILPKTSEKNQNIRIICLVKNDLMEATKCCDELMSDGFPSIWLEINLAGMKKTIIGGFYREWSRDGCDSIPEQVKRIEVLTDQFDKASIISNRVIVLGDANLCSRKWNLEKFKDKTVAEILKSSLEENGLICKFLGDTFTSDIIQNNGRIATSTIDHVYLTESMLDTTKVGTLDASSSDHLPIFAMVAHNQKKAPKMKTINHSYLILSYPFLG